MKINPLRRYEHPDLSDYVIHFVSRRWGMRNDMVPHDIYAMSPKERLFEGVLTSGEIRAFRVFYGIGADEVVCFTECTPEGVKAMIRQSYDPWGVAFTKDFVFGRGGGPAFYVRGDEWDDVWNLPPRLRSRCTKFWPGAAPGPGEVIDPALTKVCEFLPEREWRVLGTGDPASFRFESADVAFVVVGDWESAPSDYPAVRINPFTGDIDDPAGVWVITPGLAGSISRA
jgi:hypothetical protein